MSENPESVSWRLKWLARQLRRMVPAGAEQMSPVTGVEMLEFALQAKKLSEDLDAGAPVDPAPATVWVRYEVGTLPSLKVRKHCPSTEELNADTTKSWAKKTVE